MQVKRVWTFVSIYVCFEVIPNMADKNLNKNSILHVGTLYCVTAVDVLARVHHSGLPPYDDPT